MDDQAYDSYVRQLQSIHQLRDELELDEEAYRELLERLTGSRSAKFMSAAQRRSVIAFLHAYMELDAAVTHAEEARERLSSSFRAGLEDEPLDKEVYLAGELLETSKASLEAIIATLHEQHGDEVRLVGAQELRGEKGTTLRLEFDRLPF